MSERLTKYKPNELPETITRKLNVSYGIGSYVAGEIGIHDYDISKHNNEGFERITLCATEITVKIPKKQDLKKKALKVLEDEKSKILAENHLRLQGIQDKIDNLLAIEYKPESETL